MTRIVFPNTSVYNFIPSFWNHFFHLKKWDEMDKMSTPNKNFLFETLIPFYSIQPFFPTFLILQFISFYSIFFFNYFFNFPNPYTISLNLNHLYHFEIYKVKQFYSFCNYFSNHFDPKKWDGMGKMICPNIS